MSISIILAKKPKRTTSKLSPQKTKWVGPTLYRKMIEGTNDFNFTVSIFKRSLMVCDGF